MRYCPWRRGAYTIRALKLLSSIPSSRPARPPRDPPVVAATLLAARGGIDQLAVHAGRGPWLVGLLLGAAPGAEPVVNEVQSAVVPPLVKVTPHRAAWREVFGQVT